METYILSCESTADLTREHLEGRNINFICYPYELDGKSYRDDLGATIPFEDFYAAMSRGAMTKTAQINAYEFESYFESFLKDGKDILHLCLSSGITGVINSAQIARASLMEKYPQRKIFLVDSLAASSGSGLLMDQLADLRDSGLSLEELYHWTECNKLRVHHWFFSTDLQYYVRGGRISKTAGMVGTMLGICPLLNVSSDGRLIPREKIRSQKKVIAAIVSKMEQYAEHGTAYEGKCYISHSGCWDLAKQVADLVTAKFPNLAEPVQIYNIGTTIGSHTGPGTVALFFWGSPREN